MVCPILTRKDSETLHSVPGSGSDSLCVALGKSFHLSPHVFHWSGKGYINETSLLYYSSPGVLPQQSFAICDEHFGGYGHFSCIYSM